VREGHGARFRSKISRGVVVAQLRFCGRRLLCRCRVSFALLKSLTSRVHRNNVQPQAAAPPDGHRELHAQAIGGGAHLQQREADCALWRRRSPPPAQPRRKEAQQVRLRVSIACRRRWRWRSPTSCSRSRPPGSNSSEAPALKSSSSTQSASSTSPNSASAYYSRRFGPPQLGGDQETEQAEERRKRKRNRKPKPKELNAMEQMAEARHQVK
jgi:hypothetical protein